MVTAVSARGPLVRVLRKGGDAAIRVGEREGLGSHGIQAHGVLPGREAGQLVMKKNYTITTMWLQKNTVLNVDENVTNTVARTGPPGA
jgi:hypothetical protein